MSKLLGLVKYMVCRGFSLQLSRYSTSERLMKTCPSFGFNSKSPLVGEGDARHFYSVSFLAHNGYKIVSHKHRALVLLILGVWKHYKGPNSKYFRLCGS